MPRCRQHTARVVLAGIAAGCAGALLLAILVTAFSSRPARALPSFAAQTGQPCAACHVGAFGPQLKPYGRDFKLHGYTASDGKDHGLPITLAAQMTFTHTNAAQPGGAAPGFKPNDNIALNEASLYYAGRITPEIGAFIELSLDGVAQQSSVGVFDVRRASEGTLFGKDLLWGLTANNGPTVADPWNSTPVWGFPYNASALAPMPMAATFVDGGIAERAYGAGVYALWNDLVYAEFDIYKGLSPRALKAIGQVPVDDGNQTNNIFPYGRIALVKDWERHHAQIGAYALTAGYLPGGGQTFGFRNRVTDLALDANYQFMVDASKVTSDMLSAHATYIHESGNIETNGAASPFLTNHHSLDTFRADASYSFGATVTPTVQYFRTVGNADPVYWTTSTGKPNSSGMIYEVAYVPWGKPDSPFPNLNLRLAVQYVDYFKFDGSSLNARDNDNWFFSIWMAIKF